MLKHSWGGLIDIVKELDGAEALIKEQNAFSECVKKLRLVETSVNVKELLPNLFTEEERNYLNSPLLDALYSSISFEYDWGIAPNLDNPDLFLTCINKLRSLENTKTLKEIENVLSLFSKAELTYISSPLLNELDRIWKQKLYPLDIAFDSAKASFFGSETTISIKFLAQRATDKELFDAIELVQPLEKKIEIFKHMRVRRMKRDGTFPIVERIPDILKRAKHIGIVSEREQIVSNENKIDCVAFDITYSDYLRLISKHSPIHWITGLSCPEEHFAEITFNDVAYIQANTNFTFVEPISLYELYYVDVKIITKSSLHDKLILHCATLLDTERLKQYRDYTDQYVQYKDKMLIKIKDGAIIKCTPFTW